MPVDGDRQGENKMRYNHRMKTKSLTFLLALTFLFLFSGSVYGNDLRDAFSAFMAQDYEKAQKLWTQLAEQGDTEAK